VSPELLELPNCQNSRTQGLIVTLFGDKSTQLITLDGFSKNLNAVQCRDWTFYEAITLHQLQYKELK